MNRLKWYFVMSQAAVLAPMQSVIAQQRTGLGRDYFPALSRPANYPAAKFELFVYPLDKQGVSVQIPFRLETLTYAPDGTALYTSSTTRDQTCIQRVEFHPYRTIQVVCLPALRSVYSMDISVTADMVLVSGVVRNGAKPRWGLFTRQLPEGRMRTVLESPGCRASGDNYVGARLSVSLSPDAARAIAIHNDELELIDIESGTVRSLGEGLRKAAWSPDGRWIAALRRRGSKTLLMDTSNFTQDRYLDESEAQWSPDSRYLLRIKPCPFPIASNGVGTIEALDVVTGKSTAFESSRCSI